MLCPLCRAADSRVISSRETVGAIRRRRVCPQCQHRFSTLEQLIRPSLVILKKDGRREPFDRAKLLRSLQVACAKRPVATADLEAAVDRIEAALQAANEPEAPSARIGELVLQELSSLDAVAYIRFASVYHEFPDLASLQEAIALLSRRAPASLVGNR